jgi:hypothetical protein
LNGIESIDLSFDEPNLHDSDDGSVGLVVNGTGNPELVLSNDPPSSLFDFPTETRDSRTITEPLQSPERKGFTWDAVSTPKPNQDPFMDDDTVKASKVKQFVIKSPFSNGFSKSNMDLSSSRFNE